MTISHNTIITALRDSLSEDLLSTEWRKIVGKMPASNRQETSGHCAIGTEALYDLCGGSLAGYTPFVCSYFFDAAGKRHFGVAANKADKRTHWWLRAPFKNSLQNQKTGIMLDVTQGQYKTPFPYENGRATGFMSPHPPSKRARTLINRVETILGEEAIIHFRESCINDFQGNRPTIGIAAQRRQRELAPLLQKYGLQPRI